jgi:hypothetical protein
MTGRQQIEAMQALSQSAAAWLMGISARTFRDKNAPRNADGTYNAKDLLTWLSQSTPGNDDPLLAGGDSPNLERYRAAKADLAEMDARQRRGTMIDIDSFVEWWSAEVAAPVRRSVETLQSRFGAGAADIIIAAIAKADRAVEKRSEVTGEGE